MLRISFAAAASYRAENVIWLLSTTMPFVMMALFLTVARDAPVGAFDEGRFVAYFLSTFVVRTTTGSWAAWQMNMDIRDGTLAVRLLRPAPPLWTYAADNLAALPLRGVICVPIALGLLFTSARASVPKDALVWVLWSFSMLGAWLLNLLANLAIGALAFFLESSIKIMELYVAVFFVASGYLVPVELLPPVVRAVVDHLPLRFQLGFPVEIMTGVLDAEHVASKLAEQWAWVGILLGTTTLLWRRGLRRFAAFGG